MNFEGKSLFFIGDSITANGSFVSLLRSYFKKIGRKIAIFNKGIAGANVDISFETFGEDFEIFKPDYAILSLGVNDVGYWEYNSGEETEERKHLKQKRYDSYVRGITRLTEALLAMGVRPVLCSPFCVNRYLPARREIETVVDSSEKNCIKSSFYTNEAFAKVNASLEKFSNFVKSYAEEKGLPVWDLFTETYNGITADCFESDGIHYSAAGDKLIADAIARNIIGEPCSLSDVDDETEKIADLEASERAYYFVKYNIMRGIGAGLSDSELSEEVSRWIDKNGNANGLTKAREAGFFEFVINNREKQKRLTELILGKAL